MTCVQEMVNKYHLTEFEHEKLNVKQPFYIIMTMRQNEKCFLLCNVKKPM